MTFKGLFGAGAVACAAIVLGVFAVPIALSQSFGTFPTDRPNLSLKWDPADVEARADPRFVENCKRAGGKNCGNEVIKGTSASGLYPVVAMIINDWLNITNPDQRGLCSGTLIGKRVVLTAGHCIDHGIRDYVAFGDGVRREADMRTDAQGKLAAISISGSPTKFIKVSQFFRMTGDPEPGSEVDVGLLLLEEEPAIGSSTIQLAETSEIDNSPRLTAVGFGLTEKHSLGIKQYVDVIVASSSCNGSVKLETFTLTDTDWYGCTEGKELVAGRLIPFAIQNEGFAADTCNGDSGGPLFVPSDVEASIDSENKFRLAAITSRAVARTGLNDGSLRCGDGGIYVRATGTTRKWIERTLTQIDR